MMTADDVRALLRDATNGNQKAWADQHGCSQAYVSDILNGRREPGRSVLRALSLAKIVLYERA